MKNIAISEGVSGGRVLSVPADGTKVDLYGWDDNSGRQKWLIQAVQGGAFNIIITGGVSNARKYLSASPDGTVVDLWDKDDGSGRQQWIMTANVGDYWLIRSLRGVAGDRQFLSVTPDGTKVYLGNDYDDGSGRQRWKIMPAGSFPPPPPPPVTTGGAHPLPQRPSPPPRNEVEIVPAGGPFCNQTGVTMGVKNNTGRSMNVVIHRDAGLDNRTGDFTITVGPNQLVAVGCTALTNPLASAGYSIKSHN